MSAVQNELFEQIVARARRYAALSAEFRPTDAFAAEDAQDRDLLIDAASALETACDTQVGTTGGRWLMRGSERRYELRMMQERGVLEREIAGRRREGMDEETGDLLDSLSCAPSFTPGGVQARLEKPASRRELERIVLALDRAGPAAAAFDLLEPARTALYAWDRQARSEQMEQAGFVGREEERALLAQWIADPFTQAPVRALFLTGVPGIGKSWLLEDAVRRAHDQSCKTIVVRLDFDRAGLDVQDLIGLTMEVVRQIAERIGEAGRALLQSRLATASVQAGTLESMPRRDVLPRELSAQVGEAVRKDGRSVLFVLDTLEVLRARGESHPGRLFAWLDDLIGHGLAPITVVAAGRGDALDTCPDRVAQHRHLDRLDPDASARLLERLGTDPRLTTRLAELTDGNPLALRLAAKLIDRLGGEFSERTIRRGLSTSYLYRALVSRIIDPDARRLAHRGFVARRVSADLIYQALAPALGMGKLSPERASGLFQLLKKEHWLVDDDPYSSAFVRQRHEMRRTLLPLLYRDRPGTCARINAAAMRWFAARPEQWCQVEAAYHRLQLMRTNSSIPRIAPMLAAQFDAEMLEELPQKARDLVLASRGDRTGEARQVWAGDQPGKGLTNELIAIVERGDWAEGQYVVDRATSAGLDPRDPAAEAVRAFYWRCGRWSEAFDWLREHDRFAPGDEDVADLPPSLQLARLEMRAEVAFDDVRALLRGVPTFSALIVEQSWRASEIRAFSGALAFAFGRQTGEQSSGSAFLDAVHAAGAYWSETGPRRPPRSKEFERLAERLSNRLDVPPAEIYARGEAGAARIFSVDLCFEGFIGTLDKIAKSGRLSERAAEADAALAEAGGLLPAGSAAGERLGSGEQPLAGLAAMGLLAEWTEVTAFLEDDPDLAAIARSASRWRRTMSGRWSYGRHRPLWPSRLLDATLEDRVRRLVGAPDPVKAARAQLGLWLGREAEQASSAIIERLRWVVAASAQGLGDTGGAGVDRALRVAAALMKRRVPTAFVPPLVAMAGQGEI